MKLPRWIVSLLHRVVPEAWRDTVIGDLEELHRRRERRWGPVRAALVTRLEAVGLIVTHAVRRTVSQLRRGVGISSVELRLALRLLRKQPILTITSVVALGLGVGIAAGGSSLFLQVLYGEVPFEGGERWVVLQSYDEETGARAPLDLRRLALFRSRATAFEHIAGSESADVNLVHPTGEVERISGAFVTPGIFRHLPYDPILGRLPAVGDGAPGSSPVVFIRESLWKRRFSAAPDVVGHAVQIGDERRVVAGVLPDDAGFPSEGEVWIPVDEERAGADGDLDGIIGSRAIGILAPGATLEQASAQVTTLSRQASEGGDAQPLRHRIVPITDTIQSWRAQVAGVATTAVLLAVLLVIALNVANLVTARTSRRAGELAVRTAMGASRARIVGQLVAEAVVMGAAAAVPGLLVAAAILETYDRVLDELPFWIELGLDPATTAAVVMLTLLASAVVGLVPALGATRADAAGTLRASGRGASLGIGRLGGAMILTEVALSVALLGFAILFVQGFRAYVDPSFDLPEERVLTARVFVDLPAGGEREGTTASAADSVRTVTAALRSTLERLPEVTEVGVASHLPRVSPWPEPLEIEDRREVVEAPLVHQGPGVFETLEVRPVAGRLIEASDLEAGAPPVAVVNEAFAREQWGTAQAVGRRLRPLPHAGEGDPGPWRTVVGVVPNVMEVAAPAGSAGVYLPAPPGRFFYVAARLESNPMAFAGRLRRTIFDLDPGLVVSEVVRLDAVGAENRATLATLGSALSGVGLVTLLLALAGVYAVVSLAVSQRTREIGVRVALGAHRNSILWSILRRSGRLVVGGAALGAAAGAFASRFRVFAFVVPDQGLWLFPSLVLLMALAGAAACWLPARRALSVQPVEALRHDG